MRGPSGRDARPRTRRPSVSTACRTSGRVSSLADTRKVPTGHGVVVVPSGAARRSTVAPAAKSRFTRRTLLFRRASMANTTALVEALAIGHGGRHAHRPRRHRDRGCDLVDAHAHLHRQGPSRDVVRPVRGTARIEPQVRIALREQQVPQIGAKRLRAANHVGAGVVRPPVGLEGVERLLDLHAAAAQCVDHRHGRRRIPLRRRDDERLRAAGLHLIPAHLVDVVQPFLAAPAREIDHGHRGGEHVLAAVALCPPAAAIGRRVEHARLAGRQACREGARERARVVRRGRGRGVRGLGEDADHVVEVGRRAHAAVPPGVELQSRHRADLAFLLEPSRDRVSDGVDAAHDQRRDVRVDRVLERRHEDARGKRRLLVLVVDDLRKPDVIQLAGDGLRFRLREHEPVAVVVVTDVAMVQLGQRRLLIRRADMRHVPVGHLRGPIRVHVRHHQQDDVVSHPANLFGLARHHPPDEQRRGLPVGDLRRVQPEVHPDDGAAVPRQGARRRLGQHAAVPPTKGERGGDAAVVIEAREVAWRGDDGQAQRAALDRPADLDQRHAIRRGVERAQVGVNRLVRRQLVVGARLEAEHRCGCRKRSRRTRPQRHGRQRESQPGQKRDDGAHARVSRDWRSRRACGRHARPGCRGSRRPR